MVAWIDVADVRRKGNLVRKLEVVDERDADTGLQDDAGDPQLNVSARAAAPRDSSLDHWGRRNGDIATWVDVNCLRGCLGP